MTRRKTRSREREEASTYTSPPPGICDNCWQRLDDETAHCPMTGNCVGECLCDEHGGES